ncbi:uncharacterized protein LOC134846125 isoform X2 [Symsagittifera roscoffensis]|uniref:uncharacterized protein LOC134846125 isoform X2 n=1 Tax=Symsagittifera roscoffensis TaxID=84072 RepID=UPI00307B2E68
MDFVRKDTFMSLEDLAINLDDIVNSNYSFSSTEEVYFEDDEDLLDDDDVTLEHIIEEERRKHEREKEKVKTDHASHLDGKTRPTALPRINEVSEKLSMIEDIDQQTMEHELNKKAVQIETLRRLAASLSVSIGSQSEFRTEQKSIVHVIKHIGHMWRQVNELLLTREKTTTSDGSAEDKVLEIKEEQNQEGRQITENHNSTHSSDSGNKPTETDKSCTKFSKTDLSLEFEKLRDFASMYKHNRPLSKPVPVQYCSKHWHDYLVSARPVSAMSSSFLNPRTTSLSQRAASSLGVPMRSRSLYSPSISRQSRSRTPTGSRVSRHSTSASRNYRSVSRSYSRRSISPTSSIGNRNDSDDEIDALLKEVRNLKVPPPPPPPVNINHLPNHWAGYNLPCLFQCQKCGNSQPLYFPDRGLPYIPFFTGYQIKNGSKLPPESHRSRSAEKQSPKSDTEFGKLNGLKVTTNPLESEIPQRSTNSLPRTQIGTNKFNDSLASIPNLTSESIPPGSQIFVVPPGGQNFLPPGWVVPGATLATPMNGKQFPRNQTPIDVLQIMEKYPPPSDATEQPSREQLVEDALNRFEAKKRQKMKDDYLKSLKAKRDQPAPKSDLRIKTLLVDDPNDSRKTGRNPKESQTRSGNKTGDKNIGFAPSVRNKKSKYPTTCDDEDEIMTEMTDGKALESGNPSSLFNGPDSLDQWGAPNPTTLRELELAATVAAKWWEKTQNRLEKQKKAREADKQRQTTSSSRSRSPAKKSNLDSLLMRTPKSSLKSSARKDPKLFSDDECVAEFPNQQKLQSAANEIPFFDSPVNSKANRPTFKNPIATDLGPRVTSNSRSRTPVGRTNLSSLASETPSRYGSSPSPARRYPSSSFNQPKDDYSTNPETKKPQRPRVIPTTPRDTVTRYDHKLDKDSDPDSFRSDFSPNIRRPTNLPSTNGVSRPARDSRKSPEATKPRTPTIGYRGVPNTTEPKQTAKSPIRKPVRPLVREPDDEIDEDDIFLSKNFSKPGLQSAPPSGVKSRDTPNFGKKRGSDVDSLPLSSFSSNSGGQDFMSPSVSGDQTQLVPYGYPGYGNSDDYIDPRQQQQQGPPGGMVNFGNVNMYILQGDEQTRHAAFDQADRRVTAASVSPRSRSSNSNDNNASEFKIKAFHQ